MAMQLLDTSGKRLKAAREHKGLYQADLARELGITQSYLSRIENDVEPIRSMARPAAEALGVTSDFLLLLSDEPFPRAVGPAKSRADLPDDPGLEDLQRAIDETPAEQHTALVRFLIRMVDVYRETVEEG